MPLLPKNDMQYKKSWVDSLWLGIVLGIFGPWVIFFIYYFIRFSHMTFGFYVKYLKDGGIFVSSLSVAVFLSNLLIFFIFIWTKKDKSSKGVLLATILYAFFVAITKAF